MPWGWRVSSYFLTKGIAAGLTMALALALLLGADVSSGWLRWGTPLVAGLFLGLTGGLLVWVKTPVVVQASCEDPFTCKNIIGICCNEWHDLQKWCSKRIVY